MRSTILQNIRDIPAQAWNRLAGNNNPFVRHEFLAALEEHHCVGESYGWYPQHIVIHDEENHLVGAMPMYLKDNSYGELVFDWNWADAYHRQRLPYYPKLVIAIPYTPATGPRLLVTETANAEVIRQLLIQAAIDRAQELRASSVHWLFTDTQDNTALKQEGLSFRLGCQFHWQNHGYSDFADFLSHFSAQKRKQIKRERRRVQEQNILLEVRHGDEMTDELWQTLHNFYVSTFERKSGIPTLSLPFFIDLGKRMPSNIVVVLARHENRYVAGAFNMRGKETLYGRHWGCNANYHSLHFEACYYQGLDYCIRNGLQHFEPGAQGEHKISRGFLPTKTWSAHWIGHPEFRQAIGNFCQQEQNAMLDYIDELNQHSPYKAVTNP